MPSLQDSCVLLSSKPHPAQGSRPHAVLCNRHSAQRCIELSSTGPCPCTCCSTISYTCSCSTAAACRGWPSAATSTAPSITARRILLGSTADANASSDAASASSRTAPCSCRPARAPSHVGTHCWVSRLHSHSCTNTTAAACCRSIPSSWRSWPARLLAAPHRCCCISWCLQA